MNGSEPTNSHDIDINNYKNINGAKPRSPKIPKKDSVKV